ncbi:MAG: caspase family protein [Cytophagales bacterium]|nr:caspase family protein [Cytophagales bacterium]
MWRYTGIVISLSFFSIGLFAQENFNNYKQSLNSQYEKWSDRQDWKHNYIDWKKEADAAYEQWEKQNGNGIEGEFFNEFRNDFNSPFDEDKPANAEADSLQSVIQNLQQNNAATSANSEAKIQELEGQLQAIAEEQKILESLGNYKIWAVIVGVSHYRQSRIRLNYCDDDAYKIYAFLKSPEGGALPDEQIRLFVDEQAKGADIRLAVEQFTGKVGPNDVFLFYFSGHGTVTNLLAEDYGVTQSGEISHRFLSSQIRKSKAKLNLCMIDACHSGSLAIRVEAENKILGNKYAVIEDAPPPGYKSIASLESTTQFYQALQNAPKGSVFFLSSKGEETSLEFRGKRQGIFSYYFIEGLRGAADYNGDQIISVTESFDYTSKKVKEFTNNHQTPVITGQYSHQQPLAIVRKRS